jgi:hypothetical protein
MTLGKHDSPLEQVTVLLELMGANGWSPFYRRSKANVCPQQLEVNFLPA